MGHGWIAASATQTPAPGQSVAAVAAVQRPPGFVPPLHRNGSTSPVRKIVDLSGMSTREAPVSQRVSPRASRLIVLKTHVLIGGLVRFGMGSGAPNLQPALVQLLR